MGMKFLNKKGWHTGSLRNIENVWKAEQKNDAELKKLEELRKQILEEREKSEFRLLQEQAGLVPKQERLDFLYDSGLAVGKGSSDGFKELQSLPKTPEPEIASASGSASANVSAAPGALFEDKPQSANDMWRKLHSDPLLMIRQREQEALARVRNNPVQMAMIHKSIIMEEEEVPVDANFRLFSKSNKASRTAMAKPRILAVAKPVVDPEPDSTTTATTFSDLGLAQWAVETCKELGIKKPTPVQLHCIPKILAGSDVLGLAQTGSGKTAAFALPILQRLSEDPYGVFALVVTPTRELAYQLAEQFRALGSCLHLRCAVVVGGMNMIAQAQALMQRPHVVIATPGRIKVLIDTNPDISALFAKTKFIVLDEADRVLDAGFEEELRVIFQCLPKNRQTLLFSATMTSDLQTILELSPNKAYFYEAYVGLKTVESLKQQYVFVPKDVKAVYLFYILSQMEGLGVRSAIIFVSTLRSCHFLSILLEELEQEVSALYSLKSQSLRLSALHRFKSGRTPILLATDVASRGLDIPTVDLVINYDIPSCPTDYVHRVGRTARAGRGGLAISLVTQNDVDLVHKIEAVIEKELEKFECNENDVLAEISKVFKAMRIAKMKMVDDGFEEKANERKAQKVKALKEKELYRGRKRQRE